LGRLPTQTHQHTAPKTIEESDVDDITLGEKNYPLSLNAQYDANNETFLLDLPPDLHMRDLYWMGFRPKNMKVYYCGVQKSFADKYRKNKTEKNIAHTLSSQ
jgi:hypothetical protein